MEILIRPRIFLIKCAYILSIVQSTELIYVIKVWLQTIYKYVKYVFYFRKHKKKKILRLLEVSKKNC